MQVVAHVLPIVGRVQRAVRGDEEVRTDAVHVAFLFNLGPGERANIFVLTMLGCTTEVRAMLARFPALLRSKGPHGLSLLHHAKRGGAPALELFEHLQELGLEELKWPMP